VKPDETLAALQHRFARAATSLEGRPVEEISLSAWLREDLGVSARERIEIYAHAYFERIHAVLREDFGALHAALGEAAFHDLAKLYLMARPPRSFSLRFVAESLPGFLAGPVAELFRRRWPFAADLAALEWAIADLFDAPDSPILARESLASLGPEAWGSVRLRLTPAQRVLALDWPVVELHEAWAAGRALPALEPRATRVLVHRRAEQVFYREISALEAHALQRVGEGADLEALCASIADELSDDGAVAHAVALLERWLADHLLAAIEAG